MRKVKSCEKSHWRRPAIEQGISNQSIAQNGNQIKVMVSINPRMEVRKIKSKISREKFWWGENNGVPENSLWSSERLNVWSEYSTAKTSSKFFKI